LKDIVNDDEMLLFHITKNKVPTMWIQLLLETNEENPVHLFGEDFHNQLLAQGIISTTNTHVKEGTMVLKV
jgi:hypothetical protein